MTGAAAVLLLLMPALSLGAETVTLSIEETVVRAQEASEDAAIGAARRKRTHDSYIRVRSAAFPQVWGDLGWRRFADVPEQVVDFGGGPQKVGFMQPWELESNLNLTQVLWSFGQVSQAVRGARHAMEAARLSEESLKSEVAFAAKRAYYALLLAREAAAIAEQSHRNALENQKALRGRVGGGRISRMDNVKMAADVESRVPQMLEARSRERSMLIAFRRMVGAGPEADIFLSDAMAEEFPELRPSEFRAAMLAREPSLLAAKEQVGLYEAIRAVRRGGFFPTVSALANYRYYGNAREALPGSGYMDPSLLIGLKMVVPIYGGGLKKGELLEAERDREIARLAYRKLRRDLEVRLDSAVSEHRSALGVYAAANQARTLAEESYSITLSSFKAGKASQAQLNDAELMLTGARLRALQARYDMHIILARIERLVGEGRP